MEIKCVAVVFEFNEWDILNPGLDFLGENLLRGRVVVACNFPIEKYLDLRGLPEVVAVVHWLANQQVITSLTQTLALQGLDPDFGVMVKIGNLGPLL